MTIRTVKIFDMPIFSLLCVWSRKRDNLLTLRTYEITDTKRHTTTPFKLCQYHFYHFGKFFNRAFALFFHFLRNTSCLHSVCDLFIIVLFFALKSTSATCALLFIYFIHQVSSFFHLLFSCLSIYLCIFDIFMS